MAAGLRFFEQRGHVRLLSQECGAYKSAAGVGQPYHLNYAHNERPERWSRPADAVRG